ncbi:cytochrome P450 family protein [Plantactinospora endophytica]|uniref:Cytochrome P450 hydroxylase n=1 Tax=Plantactinospora endophytica TaxID=673535 RepID=A0ABQ4E0W7_9ACTN|nr:cytochrome P450 [Plantactinospora endophytica]GIG88360.1 cytochrome P450 hydroxylase [Plantactinospora endophytica]
MEDEFELPADFAGSARPHEILGRLRAAGPVQRVRLRPGPAVWLVTGYPEVLAAFGDRRLSSEARYAADVLLAESPNAGQVDDGDHLGGSMLTADPPDHTRLRRLVSKEFTARRVAALRPRIERLVADLLDGLAPRGRAELLADFALPLSMRVIGELLGVPRADREQLRRWSDALFAPPVDEAAVAAVLTARSALRGYLADLVTRKRRVPGSDLLSALAAGPVGGPVDGQVAGPLDGPVAGLVDGPARRQSDGPAREPSDGPGRGLSDDELVATGVLLLVAGYETTAGLITTGALRLLAEPGRRDAVRGDPGLVPGAVEELLRVDGAVVLGVVRYTTEDVEIAGVPIPKGQPVLLSTPAANRDPGRFPHPDVLDLTRADNPHLSFGHGIHYCLGAPLARLEAEIALGGLLHRFPDLTLAVPPDEIRWRPGAVRRLAALPVLLTGDPHGADHSAEPTR